MIPLQSGVLRVIGLGFGLGVMGLALGACAADPREGYAHVSSHDATIRTVAVPIFQNPTFSRGLETELTDAIVKEIQRSTPWRVAQDQSGGGANATLTGTLTGSNLRRLSLQRNSGYVQELAVELTVDFDFKDARTGKTLVARRNFTASDAFVPASPVNERLEAGQHAAIQKLAKDIVAELRSGW